MTIHPVEFEKGKIATAAVQRMPECIPAQIQPYRDGFKRLLDVSLVLVALPFVVPLIAFLALLIALGGGSPFYSQLRVGRDGRTFRIWKLRTMVFDAESELERYLSTNPVAQREWQIMQKLHDDPRITWLGRILRKSSLDELPQLLNVLLGSMSLVGPRPIMVEQASQYYGRAYFGLRPGITGPWQISDRNTCSFVGRIDYDEHYDQNLSFLTDLRILASTVIVVLRCTGR